MLDTRFMFISLIYSYMSRAKVTPVGGFAYWRTLRRKVQNNIPHLRDVILSSPSLRRCVVARDKLSRLDF